MTLFGESIISALDAWLIATIVFLAMLSSIYVGRRLEKRQPTSEDGKEPGNTTAIVSAMLGLLAFLLAFTFSMSSNRFDERRQVIVDEANAISTAILLSDLYPPAQRDSFRISFQQYLEARIAYYENRRDLAKILESQRTSEVYAKKLWERAAAQSRDPALSVASMRMTSALNEMFDISTTRKIGELSKVPSLIVLMLFMLCIASAFFIGYNSGGEGFDWLVAASFCFLTAIVIYITLDLDRSRRGFIQLDTPHKAIVELREMFR